MRWIFVAALVLCLALSVPGLAGADAPGATAPVFPSDGSTLQQEESIADDPTETIAIHLESDGDANVVISKEFHLQDEQERDAFDQLANEFTAGQYELGEEFFDYAVEEVDATTDREMVIENATRGADQTDTRGTLYYEFEWTNFAVAEDDTVSVGDGFTVDEGLWLRSIDDDQRLVIHGPDGYDLMEVPAGPTFRTGSLIWNGPQTFSPDDLVVTYELSDGDGMGNDNGGVGNGDGGTGDGDDGTGNGVTDPPDETGSSLLWAALLIVPLAALVLVWYTRRDDVDLTLVTVDDQSDSDDDEPAGEVTENGGAAVSGVPGETDDEVDPELLSDEERVEQLLDRNGGRMKQADIVKETGWSNAKVSQLLSQMAEDERVNKLRIGRENLITLPDEDVADLE